MVASNAECRVYLINNWIKPKTIQLFLKGSIILGFMVSGKSITNSIMLVKPATCWQFGMSKYYPRDYERNYPMPYCGMLRGKNSSPVAVIFYSRIFTVSYFICIESEYVNTWLVNYSSLCLLLLTLETSWNSSYSYNLIFTTCKLPQRS
jgi:hypothetical protein